MDSSVKSGRWFRRVASHVAGVLVATAAAASCHSSSSAGLSASCTLNSDCNSPLACVFSRCHNQCETAGDCPMGQRCVPSGTAGLNVCQLPVEQSCSGTTCETGEVCVTSDNQCRQACSGPDAGPGACVSGGACETVASVSACFELDVPTDEPELVEAGLIAADGAVIDASVFNETADGAPLPGLDGSPGVSDGAPVDGTLLEGAALDGTASDGAGDTGPDGASVVACASAQTQFGNTAQGDSNPNFTSGVGVRTATSLLIFSGYSASSDAGDGGTDNEVYVQAFDPTTADSLGPAQPLFTAPGGAGFALASASIAPTGEIALAFNYGGAYGYSATNFNEGALYGAFLAAAADGGPAGLALEQVVEIESAATTGQPHVTWSAATGAFVFSWEYQNGNYFIGTKNFRPSGQAAGGTDPVPTDNATADVYESGDGQEQGSVAVGPTLLGVAFNNTAQNRPDLTILDLGGNQVGNSVQISTDNPEWVTLGATAEGFVYVYDSGNSVSEVFLPSGGDAGVVEGDGGFDGFTFTGGVHAKDAHAINDDTGGPGGVGVALLYSNGLSFAYVNADGLTHVGPSSVIAHTFASGDQINVTNFGGSFGLSLYSAAAQSTQMAASGCSQ